jgi:CubicO group peptidase (beta-lactamase class C family)
MMTETTGFDAGRLAGMEKFFQQYVDDQRLAGWALLISRNGRIAHRSSYGWRDREAELPIEPDTLYRIYSMTKPITTVAAMMLYEQAAFALDDPISEFLPEFADPQVYESGSADDLVTGPATEPIRMRHLLTHTSGLTYGHAHEHPVDQVYRAAGFDWLPPDGVDLATLCGQLAQLPLLFQPGSGWNYGHSTDVLGRVVEVISGQSLSEFFQTRIFGPLGMTDTGFTVPADRLGRLAALYSPSSSGGIRRADEAGDVAIKGTSYLAGGHGLVGSMDDYHRFTQFLLRGGELDGVRLLSPRTLAYMTRNHLPGGGDLAVGGKPGQGFGLGFAVLADPVASGTISTPGEFGWGGVASTTFWVDPVEQLTTIFMTQLLPSGTYPFRSQLRQLTYAALID